MNIIVVFFLIVCLCCLCSFDVLCCMVCEMVILFDDFIWFIFLMVGMDDEMLIFLMFGVMCKIIDCVVIVVKEVYGLGILVICLFLYILMEYCIEDCVEVWNVNNLMNIVICVIKDVVLDLVIMIDIVLDFYNINGYDGYVCDGEILNDEMVEVLVKMVFV